MRYWKGVNRGFAFVVTAILIAEIQNKNRIWYGVMCTVLIMITAARGWWDE